MRKAKHLFAVSVFGAIALFILIAAISGALFANVSLDLSADKKHSLSEATKQVIANINEPVTLRFYYSRVLGQEVPAYGEYAARIVAMLKQYQNSRIKLEIIDPEAFSETEDQAIKDGLAPIPLYGGTLQGFFGLTASSMLGNRAVVPAFQLERRDLLEYDLTRMVQAIAQPRKAKIGVITSLPMDADMFSPLSRGDGAPAPWMFWAYMRQAFSLQRLDGNISLVPDDVDCLLVAHPRGLSSSALYAVDQFLLRKACAVILLDPHSEAAAARQIANADGAAQSSEFGKFLDHWGISMPQGKVAADRNLAQRVMLDQNKAQDYIAWLKLDAKQAAQGDGLTAHLNRLNLASAGYFDVTPKSGIKISPLLFTTKDSMGLDVEKIRFMPDLQKLLLDFKPDGVERVLALRLSGKLTSVFGAAAPDSAKSKDVKMPQHLAESEKSAAIILVADSDLTEDRFWAKIPESLKNGYLMPNADNADFILSAIEDAISGISLSEIRVRATGARSLEKLDAMRRQAEDKFLTQEAALKIKLQDAQTRLTRLLAQQKEKGESAEQEIEQTILQAKSDMLAAQQELRKVQLELNRGVQGLQDRLRFLLVFAWPVLACFGIWAAGRWVWRARRDSNS